MSNEISLHLGIHACSDEEGSTCEEHPIGMDSE
jgi:hypothetical protein